jgi:hypothetical protein
MTLNRTVGLLAFAGATACTAGHQPTNAAAQARYPSTMYTQCNGDDLLEVSNPGNAPVDVYAYTGSVGQTAFVATASRGTSTVSLVNTAVERKSTAFVARYNGTDVYQVRFRRYCGAA